MVDLKTGKIVDNQPLFPSIIEYQQQREPMKKEFYTDIFTASTLQEDGEICCPTCGSWTHVDDLEVDEFEGTTHCPLCRN